MKEKFEIPHCETCASRMISVFSELSHSDIEKLSLHKGCNFHRAGQVLFQAGGYPAGLYCINKGKVKLFKAEPDGTEQVMRLAKDGEVVGYRSLIGGTQYALSAAIIEDSTICFVPRGTFRSLLKENPSFNARIMQLLCRDLATAEQRQLFFSRRSVKERLAETLVMLKEFYGVEDDGVTIKGSLSREDIANIVGTATETVIRLLSELNKKKIIALDQRKIRIFSSSALLRAARVFD